MLVKKRLLTTVIDRPTLGCFKKVGGVRGRLCKTGFDCLVLLRVGFFVAELLFNVCVLWLCSYVVPYVFHGFRDPFKSRSSNSSVRRVPWNNVFSGVSR